MHKKTTSESQHNYFNSTANDKDTSSFFKQSWSAAVTCCAFAEQKRTAFGREQRLRDWRGHFPMWFVLVCVCLTSGVWHRTVPSACVWGTSCSGLRAGHGYEWNSTLDRAVSDAAWSCSFCTAPAAAWSEPDATAALDFRSSDQLRPRTFCSTRSEASGVESHTKQWATFYSACLLLTFVANN